MDLILDVNIQIYPVDLGKDATFLLFIFILLVIIVIVLSYKSFI